MPYYERAVVNGEHYRKSMAIDTQFTQDLTGGLHTFARLKDSLKSIHKIIFREYQIF